MWDEEAETLVGAAEGASGTVAAIIDTPVDCEPSLIQFEADTVNTYAQPVVGVEKV